MEKERAEYNLWLERLKDSQKDKKELESIKDSPAEIEDRFFQNLSFGTAGLRGIIGLGTNRMNRFTVGKATQGLAQQLIEAGKDKIVAIGYDSRNFSLEFSQHTAEILAANGFQVHLFPHLVPTPMLAYATQKLHCSCGIMITASHNPAIYNGYKVFNGLGCQIDTNTANEVMDEISKVDIFRGVPIIPFEEGLRSGVIKYIPAALEEEFCSATLSQSLRPEVCASAGLKVVYTPLNGAGNLFVRSVLTRLGVANLHIVKEQELPDGNFPTCPYPNPEFPEALELGLRDAKEVNADVLLATDPDSDRVAIAVRNNNEYLIFTGNQLGVLLLDYMADTRIRLGKMPKNPVAVRSIVTTKLTDKVASDYGVTVHSVLTGFRYVGEYIQELYQTGEEDRFIFGFEEAIGYLVGTHVRDKDAVVASALIIEMLSHYKAIGKNPVERLEEIYEKHGYYSNMAQNLAFDGPDGMDKMKGIMSHLRQNPPDKIVGRRVTGVLDYLTSKSIIDGVESTISTEPSNVIEYMLEDGCGIIIRPSGTEPKLKLYYSLIGKTHEDRIRLELEYGEAANQLTTV